MVLKVAKSTGSPDHRRTVHADAAREAAMLHRLSHENVVALRGVCIQVSDDGECVRTSILLIDTTLPLS